MKITNRIVQDYLNCRYKAHLAAKGETGTPHDYELLMRQLNAEYQPKATEVLLRRCKLESAPTFPALTTGDLTQGHPLILDSTVEHEQLQFHFSALKRVEGNSSLGDFHYAPILFHYEENVRAEHRLLLGFGALLLGHHQGIVPECGDVLFGRGYDVAKVRLSKCEKLARQVVEDLISAQSGTGGIKLRLNKHCDACGFRERCQAEAIQKDDLSLLRGMSDAEIEKQHAKGIFTVNQLSYTFRARRRPKRLKNRRPPYSPALQAQAIRESKVYVFNPPSIPTPTTAVYVDMEGNSNATAIYLIGTLVAHGETTAFESFWADTPEDEAGMFRRLFDLIASLDGPQIFHYGSYEATAFRRILSSMPARRDVRLLAEQSVNVLAAVYANVYFPTYSNGLKDIGRYLGCRWSDSQASGLQSVVWRSRYVATGDSQWKDKLLEYNREDCMALKSLTEYLSQISTEAQAGRHGELALVESLRYQEDYGRWGQRKFALEQFRTVADCAYFDYQRTKVFIRTIPNLRKIARHKRHRMLKGNKASVTITVSAIKCWRCKGTAITRDETRYHEKLQFDLRFYSTGIRRWVTRYRTPFHRCSECRTPMFPRSYKSKERFGHGLIAWTIYQHIVNRTPFDSLSRTASDCFGLHIPGPWYHHIKHIAAQFYKRTYNQILRSLLSGNLIHADETKMKLSNESGYVWVLANMENVVYLYRPNREGAFLHALLDGFGGVLVTDFYSAYDSLACAQQKCLVHLMWDINADLLKNPFDEDMKLLASEFGELLRGIIQTADRFGLRTRYLKRHKPKVQQFFEAVEARHMTSSVALRYQDRMRVCQDKLFTFLDHEGIPWNNNNAEHAIKPLAKYRRLTGHTMNERGISAYLTLLSIYQTCEYRGVSFLDFLRSKQRDIDAFCEAVW